MMTFHCVSLASLTLMAYFPEAGTDSLAASGGLGRLSSRGARSVPAWREVTRGGSVEMKRVRFPFIVVIGEEGSLLRGH